MKIAIMQPYFLPYIGYFQMIKAVDAFVFYDDVNYINRGWINRNRILINGQPKYFNVPLIKASQNKLINEIQVNKDSKDYSNLLKTIEMAYKRAPYFEQVYQVLENLLNKDYNTVDEITIKSIKEISNYLEIPTKFLISSIDFPKTRGMDKAKRLKAICKKTNSTNYINAIGGQDLYSKEDFAKENINLKFIKSLPIEYKQFDNEFVPWLSIIDVLMFNSQREVNKMLDNFKLI